MPQRLSRLLVVLLLAVVPACASSGATGNSAPGADGIAIRVKNDLIPGTTVTVSAVTETGGRALLGTVIPGGEQTFTYRPIGNLTEYQLVAEPTGASNARLVSRPIIPAANPDATVVWELRTNNIIVNP